MLNLRNVLLATVLTATFALSSPTFAGAKKYQVTGTVLELTETTVIVQKGEDKWELDRDPKTVIKGKLEVGAKVTIEYRMTAINVEVKPAKGDKADKGEKGDKSEKGDKAEKSGK